MRKGSGGAFSRQEAAISALYVGAKTLDDRSLEEVYNKALETAAQQLSYRALSAQALREKLTDKGYPEEAAEYAVAWLSERGLLNDGKLAESVVRSYERRGYGQMRIRQELKKRGIERDCADEALDAFEADVDKMTVLLDKRLRGDLTDRKEIDKAVAALQRRGYRWEDIREALRVYGASLEESFE